MADEWSVERAVQDTERFMRGLGLPEMLRPEGLGTEYAFPTNVRFLTSLQLGDLQLRLCAWYTYLLDAIGREESESVALDAVFEIKLGVKTHQLRVRSDEGRPPAQEVFRALAVTEDDELKRLKQNLIARQMRITRLQAQAKIYTEQLSRLSREQSRREGEQRLPGVG